MLKKMSKKNVKKNDVEKKRAKKMSYTKRQKKSAPRFCTKNIPKMDKTVICLLHWFSV